MTFPVNWTEWVIGLNLSWKYSRRISSWLGFDFDLYAIHSIFQSIEKILEKFESLEECLKISTNIRWNGLSNNKKIFQNEVNVETSSDGNNFHDN